MRVEQLAHGPCKSYLLSCEETARALLVDPVAARTDELAQLLDERGLTLDLVLDTHTHADHVSGGAELSERLDVPYALHADTTSSLPNERVTDGRRLEVGRGRVEVIHTPGHTPDSISLLAGGALLTGDFLFLAQDGAGRLDLPGGDPEAHWDSLRRLAELPDDLTVLPGHDYNDLDASELGVERRRNPRFQQVSREEYGAWQRLVAQPTPDWMLEVIATNLGRSAEHAAHHGSAHDAPSLPLQLGAADTAGACCANPMGRVPTILPDAAHERMTSDDPPYLLDVREPWEFHGPSGRHAPGARLLPLAHVPHAYRELPIGPDDELLVICRSGGRSARAAEFLIDRGFRRVFNVATGTDGWEAMGLPVER